MSQQTTTDKPVQTSLFSLPEATPPHQTTQDTAVRPPEPVQEPVLNDEVRNRRSQSEWDASVEYFFSRGH